MSFLNRLGGDLYRGERSFDFCGPRRRRRWFTISGLVLLLALAGLLVRGPQLSVEFTGGAVFNFKASGATTEQVRDTVASVVGGPSVPIVQEAGDQWKVTTSQLSPPKVAEVQEAISGEFGIPVDTISPQSIGPTWGTQVSEKALIALGIFLVLVVLYLSMAFEWKMAVGALVALLHDVVITVGVYAWIGFEISPATVIGFLTILGYSLYDTVVVFDKVRENTEGLLGPTPKRDYTQAANLAVNQVLVRSINTSVTGLLPVAAILFIGTTLLGAATLKDLALALFVGMIVGTFSSIFIACPVLVLLKEREPEMQQLAKRVAARGKKAAAQAAVPVDDVDDVDDVADVAPSGAGRPTVTVSGRRQQPKRSTPRKKRR